MLLEYLLKSFVNKPHCFLLQTMSDGFTFLEKAVIEHNMLAIGKIYENIRLPELASILMIDERRAEKVAATMITENRLQGYIDQSGKLLLHLAVISCLHFIHNVP